MNPKDKPESHLSILAAQNGSLIVFQGCNKQALFIQREHVPRFIHDPENTPVIVIPSLASLALECYSAMETIDCILLTRDLAISDDYTLTLRRQSGESIQFFSDQERLPGARTLRAERVKIAITPTMICHVVGDEPRLVILVACDLDDAPNYPARFAMNPGLISKAVAHATSRYAAKLAYEN